MTADRIRLIKFAATFVAPIVVVSIAASVPPVIAAPSYYILPLGLEDLAHTRNDGYKESSAYILNDAGQVLGHSTRFLGGSTEMGRSAWLYDGVTTVDIGLTGAEYTGIGGYKYSYGWQLNAAGQVIGNSFRLNAGFGQSAWLYDGTTTIDIGLTGSEYTANNGNKYSVVEQLNETGQVIGASDYFNGGSAAIGSTAWVYSGANIVKLGLTDNEHTNNNGGKRSHPLRLNEAGQVAGTSTRYNGGSLNSGPSAWFYDGTSTIHIGLTDNEHTSVAGYKDSAPIQLNEAGQVLGYSATFRGAGYYGRSVWLFDGGNTIRIGLTDNEHTGNNGLRSSDGRQLNEAGQVIGDSDRYNGAGTNSGDSAWLYDGVNTINIGLIGSEHTGSDGYKSSFATQLNQAGLVCGHSDRFNGGNTLLGQSAWLHNGATTIDIGLTDNDHTRNDGTKYSNNRQMNGAGHVIGISRRYNGSSTELGQSAWLYDGVTTVDIGLDDSQYTRSDGFRYSDVSQLNGAGQVVGSSDHYLGSVNMGTDAWFYDPALDYTFAIRLSTRSDGYAAQ